MVSKQQNEKMNLQRFLAPCVIGAFFCFLYFYFGVGQYPDTVTYLQQSSDREPVYPLLLQLFRMIFSEKYDLQAVAAAQNIFAAWTTWYLFSYVKKSFRLCVPAQVCAVLVLLAPHLLTGLFTSSGIILTNAILSEGISVTLYQLFFTLLLKMVFEEKKKSIWCVLALVTAFVTTLARGQMMIMPLIWMVVSGAQAVLQRTQTLHGRRKKAGRMVLILAATLFCFLLRGTLISAYNYAVNDHYHGNTSGSMTLLTNVLYSASVEEAENIDDPELQSLFLNIYSQMEEQKLTCVDAGTGVEQRVLHHEDSHDRIKFGVLDGAISQYVVNHYGTTDATEKKILMDETAGKLMKEILPGSFGSWLRTYFYVVCGGLIRTVAILYPFMGLYALLIYVVAIGLMWYLFRQDRTSRAAVMMLVVLLMIAANVFAIALTIMCLSRYMIYNMSIFYLAGIVMLQEIVHRKRSEKQNGISKSEI